ncbi:DUF1217 domain-containing protein [Rhodomicrobium vannielii ATCC 17100]|uniref:DUF1217 domain-containing protein n=1 Tax=Rhodomicrobium vannielii TaxID=1069 RepID=UPI001919D3FF|nr:DUF1217 domain-containing protein [Rhodomicrobium vannielii]MBJ7535939.1 DUF1217 domain-containing protein [Rhodomicrobium vannielii ATCC 17100]
MTSTLTTFLSITNNYSKWTEMTAAEPSVASKTEYYKANIGNITSPEELVADYKLFSYALTAYGLGDQVYAKALYKKVLSEGADSKSLAAKLGNLGTMELAKTFNFEENGTSTTTSDAVQNDVVDLYLAQTLEEKQGETNEGAQMALYFYRNASKIDSVYDILADKTLLKTVYTALGLSEYTAAMDIDKQASLLSKALDLSDFQDPQKLTSFIAKFSTLYDSENNNTASDYVSALFGTSSSNGVVSFSVDLLSRVQGLSLGGVWR